MFHSLNSTQDQFHQVISKLGNMQLAEGYDVEEVGGEIGGGMKCGRAVLLPDGNVLVIPLRSGKFYLYNPTTKQTEFVCDAPEGAAGYYGGAVLPGGNVLLNPSLATRVALYDAATRTCRQVGGVINPNKASDFIDSSQLLPSGKVLLVKCNSPFCYLYDPFFESVVQISENINMSGGFIGAQLMQNGIVILISISSAGCVLYDYKSNSFAPGPAGNSMFNAGILPSGNVLIPYYNTSQCRIYNHHRNTIASAGDVLSGSMLGCGCVHVGDGSLVIIPRRMEYASVYDERLNTTISLTAVRGGGEAYCGGVCLPDSGILLIPNVKSRILLIKPRGVMPLPLQTCLSPYLNNT